tara:strand:- start:273 stop:608 length:336 start_codon:yes stop_codon:yes gene_type:complete
MPRENHIMASKSALAKRDASLTRRNQNLRTRLKTAQKKANPAMVGISAGLGSAFASDVDGMIGEFSGVKGSGIVGSILVIAGASFASPSMAAAGGGMAGAAMRELLQTSIG